MAYRTECSTEDVSWDVFYVAEEATWGCQRAARLPFLPTPPSPLLFKSVKKQNLRQGRGTDICRVNREGDLWGRVQHCCLIPYRPPSGGGTIRKFPLTNKETQKGKYVWPPWIYNIFLIRQKIWPIMSWSLARLQPRGPSCPLLLSRCLQVMEMVNILHAFISFRFEKNNRGSTIGVEIPAPSWKSL